MSRVRANSYPDLIPDETTNISEQQYDDSALEGVAAHIKLLLKLTQDHKDACDKEKNDRRRMLRVATMMTILDNVRDRIGKCQSFGNKGSSDPELRRCNTDVRQRNHIPRDKKPPSVEPPVDENDKLRRQLSASLAARKSLEIMCSSLGKEKEIMTGELSKKVYELRELEDLVSDLKAQNDMLLEKVHEFTVEKPQGNVVLQERNKALSEQLLRSLDGYKSMKRRLKELQEENLMLRRVMDEMGVKMLADKREPKQGECVKAKGEMINVPKPSVLA